MAVPADVSKLKIPTLLLLLVAESMLICSALLSYTLSSVLLVSVFISVDAGSWIFSIVTVGILLVIFIILFWLPIGSYRKKRYKKSLVTSGVILALCVVLWIYDGIKIKENVAAHTLGSGFLVPGPNTILPGYTKVSGGQFKTSYSYDYYHYDRPLKDPKNPFSTAANGTLRIDEMMVRCPGYAPGILQPFTFQGMGGGILDRRTLGASRLPWGSIELFLNDGNKCLHMNLHFPSKDGYTPDTLIGLLPSFVRN